MLPLVLSQAIDKDVPLCNYHGNDCFYEKFSNSSYKLMSCNCLPSCSEVKYKYVIDSSRKFSEVEVDQLCNTHRPHLLYVEQGLQATFEISRIRNFSAELHEETRKVCKQYIQNEYALITVRIEGSSFLRRTASLKYNMSDKVAVIGGTLGLFSGFSILVLFEILFWVFMTLKKAISNSTPPKDPMEILNDQVTATSCQIEQIMQELEQMKEKLKKFEQNSSASKQDMNQKESQSSSQNVIVENIE